jgi:hypothetical protein
VRNDGGRVRRREANGAPNATREGPESLDWPNPAEGVKQFARATQPQAGDDDDARPADATLELLLRSDSSA